MCAGLTYKEDVEGGMDRDVEEDWLVTCTVRRDAPYTYHIHAVLTGRSKVDHMSTHHTTSNQPNTRQNKQCWNGVVADVAGLAAPAHMHAQDTLPDTLCTTCPSLCLPGQAARSLCSCICSGMKLIFLQ